MNGPRYPADEEAALKRCFVIDRIDGKPILAGHADCPDCDNPLSLHPMGRMDLTDDGVRVHLRVECSECGCGLRLVEDFDWGP